MTIHMNPSQSGTAQAFSIGLTDSDHKNLTIRQGTRRDRQAVCRLEMACFGKARLLFGLWWLIGKPTTNLWVAEEAGQMIGYVIAYPNELSGHILPYIGGVGVSPTRRNAGIGAKMMLAALVQYPHLWLHVRASNAPAIRLYKKLGFIELKRELEFYSNGEDALILATKECN